MAGRGVDLNGVKAFLLADEAVFAHFGNRIFIDWWLPSTDQKEDAYELSDGPALVLTPRGGAGSTDYKMGNQNVLVRIFGQTVAEVTTGDNVLFNAFKKTGTPTNNTDFYAKDTVSPDLRRTSETGGVYVMASTWQIAQVI